MFSWVTRWYANGYKNTNFSALGSCRLFLFFFSSLLSQHRCAEVVYEITPHTLYPMGVESESVSFFNLSMFFFFILILLPPHYHCSQVYNITPFQPLAQGDTLVSPSSIFELGFFSPNGSARKYVGIWHKNIFPRKVVWVANREKPIAVTSSLASLRISSNGSLELVDGKQNSLWSTDVTSEVSSSNTSSVAALLLDSGNFIVKDDAEADGVVWQSFDYPGDTMLPTQRVQYNTKSKKGTILTAWKSESDPSAGIYTVEGGRATEVPAQVIIWINRSTPFWRSGPWDKSKFIGVPDMDDRYLSGFTGEEDVEEGTQYFSYKSFGTLATYGDISSQGNFKFMYVQNGRNWSLYLKTLKNSCDIYGACGPFGVCNISESPICKCLKGFVPSSDQEWRKGNWTMGCVRQTNLFCERQTDKKSFSLQGKQVYNDDGFWKMTGAKVPDYHQYITSLNTDDINGCMIQCLNNCSCLAYALVNNIGCLVWSKDLIDIVEFSQGGVDLYVRLARKELDSFAGEGKPIKLIAILTAIGLMIILVAILFGLQKLRANQKGSIPTSRDTLREYIGKHDPSELLIYDFDTMLTATDNFSITNKLGQGGFGPVYKGILQDGKEIAVKRLSSSSGQGIEEFKNEMLLISNLQHKNLVRMMGCCIKEDEKLLVYEFMPNKSLDTFLFDPMRRGELDWDRRFNIIQGVARGLLYLHHDSYVKVIHRDLKVSNILLDEKMKPKISDFGLARIVEGTQCIENTQKVVGTRGYMSPEYALGGIFSEKSDVYSFRVLELDIISGKKNNNFFLYDQQLGFLAHAWNLWYEGKGLELADEVLGDSYSSSEVLKCVHIGLLCVQDNAADRPTMKDIALMLSSEKDGPQPKRPEFTMQNSFSHPQPQNEHTNSPINEATITVIEGR